MPLALTAATVLLLDFATKYLAAEKIPASVTNNYGLAFSIGSPATAIIITTAITAVLFFYFLKNKNSWERSEQIGFGLILGGAVANLSERIYSGHVTDFIRIANSVLNFADLSIFLGLALIVFYANKNKFGSNTRP